MKADPVTLDELIGQRGHRHGMSRSEVARRSGMNTSELSRVVCGDQPLGPLRAQRLADTLGVGVEQVLLAARQPARPLHGSALSSVLEQVAARHGGIEQFCRHAGISTRMLHTAVRDPRRTPPEVVRILTEHGASPAEVLHAAGIHVPEGVCGQLTLQRWRRGLSRAEVITEAPVSQQVLDLIENGTLPRSIIPALRVARVVGVPSVDITAAYQDSGETAFARALYVRMRACLLNTHTLADKVGVSHQAVSRWLLRSRPRANVFDRIITAVGDPDGALRAAYNPHPDLHR